MVELTVRAAEQGGSVGCSSHVEAIVSPQVGRLSLRTQSNTHTVEGIVSLTNELDNAVSRIVARPPVGPENSSPRDTGKLSPVSSRGSPLVVVMQPTHLWDFADRANLRPLDRCGTGQSMSNVRCVRQ